MRHTTVAALLAWLARDAAAGGYTFNDFGERRAAMHAVAGRPDDPTATFHNPAGLADLGGTQSYVSLTQIFFDVDVRLYDSMFALHPPPDEPALTPDRVYAVNPFLGFSTDLGRRGLGLGLAFYAPVATGAFFPDDTPLRYHAVEAYFVAGYATLAAGYRVSPWLSLGAGVSLVHVRFREQRIVNVQQVVAGPNDPSAYDQRFDPSTYDGNLDYELIAEGSDTTLGATLGVLVHPHPRLGLGFSFVSEADTSLGGPITLRSRAMPTQIDSATQTTDFVIPPGLRMGVNWQALPWLEAGLDYYVYFYEVIDSQTTRITPDDPDDPGLFSALRLQGTKDLGVRSEKSSGRNHILSGGLGFRVLENRRYARRIDLFLGGEYDITPFSEADFSLESPTRSFWGVSAGARYAATERLTFGLAWWLERSLAIDVRESRSVPPANAVVDGGNQALVLSARARF